MNLALESCWKFAADACDASAAAALAVRTAGGAARATAGAHPEVDATAAYNVVAVAAPASTFASLPVASSHAEAEIDATHQIAFAASVVDDCVNADVGAVERVALCRVRSVDALRAILASASPLAYATQFDLQCPSPRSSDWVTLATPSLGPLLVL